MLSFPEGFFESEEREGFLVDSTMKTVWAAELEVLAAIADVCEKYQLPWFADWGTLLGAVRHKGFIPWDDDIDICMIREDYDRLMQVLQKELPEGYRVYNTACGNVQEQYWTCVMNANTISIERERLQKFHGCPFIVGVDIFPLDYIPRNKQVADAENALFLLIWKAVQLARVEEPNKKQKKDLRDALHAIEDFCKIKFERSKPLVAQLWTLGNQVCGTYGEQDGDILASYLTYLKWPNIHFHKSWFDDVEYLPFESVYLPVPKNYDAVLKAEFGDYMTPVRDTQSHDYPFYNKQLEQMRKMLQEMEEKNVKLSGGVL